MLGTFLDVKQKNIELKSHKCIFIGYYEDSKMYILFNQSTHGVIITQVFQFSEVSLPPHESIEPHSSLNFPSSLFSPIYFTRSSPYVAPKLDPSSPSSSSDPSECFEYTNVVPTNTHLIVWTQKTLESTIIEIGIPSYSH